MPSGRAGCCPSPPAPAGENRIPIACVGAGITAGFGPADHATQDYPPNPVDNLAPLTRAELPLIHVVSQAATLVPVEENTGTIVDSSCATPGNGAAGPPYGTFGSQPLKRSQDSKCRGHSDVGPSFGSMPEPCGPFG
jgi:hypothetical protein